MENDVYAFEILKLDVGDWSLVLLKNGHVVGGYVGQILMTPYKWQAITGSHLRVRAFPHISTNHKPGLNAALWTLLSISESDLMRERSAGPDIF
jgi:hypothetical protein